MIPPVNQMTPITPWPLDSRLTEAVILGGSFDPPHLGHVQLARAARDAFAPDAGLVFVPAHRSPFKAAGSSATSPSDRAAMLRLAIRGLHDSAVWTDEVDRGLHDPIAPSYTIDTLLRARAAGARRLWLMLGGDQIVQFHRWRDPRRILDLAQPIVLLRPPLTAVGELRDSLLAVPGPERADGPALNVGGCTRFWTDAEVDALCTSTLPIDPALAPVSSSEIRRTIMTRGVQAVPTGWLNPEVADFITSHGLYQP